MLEIWELYYSECSAFSHGDASTWNAFATEDGTTLNFGPSPEGIHEVLGPALSALFGGLQLLQHVFKDSELSGVLERIAGMFPESTKRLDLRSQFEFPRNCG
jgi:hypothetical protein